LDVAAIVHKLVEDRRNVAATGPAGVDEDGEALGIETHLGSDHCLLAFIRQLKLRMNRNPTDADLVLIDSKIDQLLSCLLGADKVETHLITSPASPEAVARISNHRHKRNAIEQSQVSQHSAEDVLSHRMDRDDDLRAITLEQLLDVTRGQTVEEA